MYFEENTLKLFLWLLYSSTPAVMSGLDRYQGKKSAGKLSITTRGIMFALSFEPTRSLSINRGRRTREFKH
ncbi:hypothetical protein BJ165DRAFT_1463043 [Panaeolus papilionaceus]|nr:hypothetical protein BJ165DRAFT_1463043 [Panaeolus papilionaceus]